MSEGREGEELRAARIRAGLTQEEAARRAGISVRTVRHIERGQVRNPRHASLDAWPAWSATGARRPRSGTGRRPHDTAPRRLRDTPAGAADRAACREAGRHAAETACPPRTAGGPARPGRPARRDGRRALARPAAAQPRQSVAHLRRPLRRVLDEDTGSAAGRRIRTVRGGYVLDSDGVRLDLRSSTNASPTPGRPPPPPGRSPGAVRRGPAQQTGPAARGRVASVAASAVVRVAQRHVDVAIDCADLALRLNRPASAVEHLAAPRTRNRCTSRYRPG
ncbi:helix-turn-helix transcriptional regulator [Streptomyces tendae]|uniref:Helix-turn-helix transcriptional regulator n=1 Tax=Streptomyces tendae TaxID=1932 RepID=A0ABX5ZS04_STRTE|nr:helix-turn-helix transcriptional regulator [Streptomyces tendae]